MTMKLRTIYLSQIFFALHFLGIFGSIAQDQSNDYSGLSIKFTCSKSEIIAGENFEFEVVISNSAQHRISSAPPAFMVYLDLIIQENGRTIPYQTKYMRVGGYGPDLEIEANDIWEMSGDLYEANPSGLWAGNFTLSASYSPNRTNRSFKIRSNTIQLTVAPRSQEQEAEYNDYIKVLRLPGELGIQQALQFLAAYTNSLWEPTVRLWLASRYMTRNDYDSARKTLEVVPLLPSATKQDVFRKHDLASRALEGQGYLYEALAELEASPLASRDPKIKPLKLEFTMLHLAAQVRLEPEALKVSPGVLTAFVRLPEGYPVSGIISATCDHAPAERMMLSDDGTEMIMKFRRQDIEEAQARIGKSIDTNFVVQGNWKGNVVTERGTRTSSYFWGTASITKIVGAKQKK